MDVLRFAILLACAFLAVDALALVDLDEDAVDALGAPLVDIDKNAIDTLETPFVGNDKDAVDALGTALVGIDDDAVDRILEEVQIMNARNVREASDSSTTKATASKKPDKKQKNKSKDKGCGASSAEVEKVTEKVKEKNIHKKVEGEADCPPPTVGHPYEVLSLNHGDEDVDEEEFDQSSSNKKPAVNQTAVFLNIINDLNTLKNATVKTKGEVTDGIPAHLTGIWLSEIAGLRFSLQERPAPTTTTQAPSQPNQQSAHVQRGELRVSVADRRVRPREKLLSTDWQFDAQAPVAMGAPFNMVAKLQAEKRIAVFLGQAKVCAQKEVIYGGWLFGSVSSSTTCREAELSIWSRNEIMRRGRPVSAAGGVGGIGGVGSVGGIGGFGIAGAMGCAGGNATHL